MEDGWAVFPVGIDKKPLLPKGVQEKYLYQQASEEEIRQFWTEFPNANVGLACGKVSGRTVVDFDGGDDSQFPETYTVQTPSGGTHRIYQYSDEIHTGTERLPGVDIRNDGGYIVGEGSHCEYYKKSKFIVGDYVAVETFPASIFPIHLFPRPKSRALIQNMVALKEGQGRNSTIASFIGTLLQALPETKWDEAYQAAYAIWKTYEHADRDIQEFMNAWRSISATELGRRQESSAKSEKSYFQTVMDTMVKLRDLPEPPPIEWLWEGYIAKGAATMFTGVWKGGKTVFVSHLLNHMEKNPDSHYLGYATKAVKTLIMTEEPASFWHRRMAQLNFGEHILVNSYPFPRKPTAKEWAEFLEELAPWMVKNEYGMVIFDSATDILPITNENDSGDVIRSLKPLNFLKKENIAILMLHHPSKGSSGSDEETIDTSFRGSGAFGGFVENLMTITRPPGQTYSVERTIAIRSRYGDAPEPIVVEMKDKDTPTEKYVLKGGAREQKEKNHSDKVLDVLRSSTGMSIPELHAAVGGGSKDHTYTVVNQLFQAGKVYLKETVRNAKNGKPTDYYAIKPQDLDKALDLALNQNLKMPKSGNISPLRGGIKQDLDPNTIKRATEAEKDAQEDWFEEI